MTDVTLIQCTDAKRDQPAAAKDLYDESVYFRRMRSWAKARGDPWYIISAKYGLLTPDERVSPYDERGLSESQAETISESLHNDGVTTILFGSSIAVANITAAKVAGIPLPALGTVGVPAGFIAFGVAFLVSDLITEFYGEEYAADVVNATVVALGVAYVLVWVAVGLPAAPFYDAAAYNQVLGGSAAVVAASIVTLALSQRFDVWLFARVRERTGAGHRYARNLISTGASQVVDTVVFITLAFAVFPAVQGGDPMWGVPLVMTIVGQYLAKLVVAVADTPLFYAATAFARRE